MKYFKAIATSMTVALTLSSFTACDSKYVESEPESVKGDGISLETRVVQKQAIDDKMNQVDRVAEKVKRMLNMFKNIQAPKQSEDVYTPLDFIIDLNSELRTKMPLISGETQVRQGQVELKFSHLSDECKTIDTQLETADHVDATGSAVIGQTLKYSVRNCYTEGKYIEWAVFQWSENRIRMNFRSEAFNLIFNKKMIQDLVKNQNCEFFHDEKDMLQSFQCKDLNLRLSQSEEAVVGTLNYSNMDDIRLEVIADVFENEAKKLTSTVRMYSSGKKEVQVKKY